ncbi:MAG: DUF3105 domain-containing protein [Patescibacteria group bacterium]
MRKRSFISALWLIPLLLAGLIIWSIAQPKPGESLDSLGNQHIATIEETHGPYNSKPPTSGPHLNQKAPWGVSEEQLPDELQVHNLEDGGVIIHYDPAIDTGTVMQLTNLVERYPDKVILEPYAGMDKPIVMTAWTKIDKLDTYDEERIAAFISAYRNIDHHE